MYKAVQEGPGMWRTTYLPDPSEMTGNLLELYKPIEVGPITNYRVHNDVAPGGFYRQSSTAPIHEDAFEEENSTQERNTQESDCRVPNLVPDAYANDDSEQDEPHTTSADEFLNIGTDSDSDDNDNEETSSTNVHAISNALQVRIHVLYECYF